jgi:hypothetical protein
MVNEMLTPSIARLTTRGQLWYNHVIHLANHHLVPVPRISEGRSEISLFAQIDSPLTNRVKDVCPDLV